MASHEQAVWDWEYEKMMGTLARAKMMLEVCRQHLDCASNLLVTQKGFNVFQCVFVFKNN